MRLDRKKSFQEIIFTSLGALISGFIGSFIIFIFLFFVGNFTTMLPEINSRDLYTTHIGILFTIILAFITLIGTTISAMINYKFLRLTDGQDYKQNNVVTTQILFFQFFTFLFFLPIYIIYGGDNIGNVIFVYVFNIFVSYFGVSLLIEILNNFKYIILSIYGISVGLLFNIFFTIFTLNIDKPGFSTIILLIFLLPIISFVNIFAKKILELLYYFFYRFSGSDPLGNIFHKIEMEQKETEKEEAEKNLLY